MTEDKTGVLLDNIRQQLDESVDSLDAVTAARLQAARKTALQGSRRRPWFIYFAPAVTASLLAVSLAVLFNAQTTTSVGMMEDLHLLSSNEEIDFYENIDFYQWLEESNADG